MGTRNVVDQSWSSLRSLEFFASGCRPLGAGIVDRNEMDIALYQQIEKKVIEITSGREGV